MIHSFFFFVAFFKFMGALLGHKWAFGVITPTWPLKWNCFHISRTNDDSKTKNAIKLVWKLVIGPNKGAKEISMQSCAQITSNLKAILCNDKPNLLPKSYLRTRQLNCNCIVIAVVKQNKHWCNSKSPQKKKYDRKMGIIRCNRTH